MTDLAGRQFKTFAMETATESTFIAPLSSLPQRQKHPSAQFASLSQIGQYAQPKQPEAEPSFQTPSTLIMPPTSFAAAPSAPSTSLTPSVPRPVSSPGLLSAAGFTPSAFRNSFQAPAAPTQSASMPVSSPGYPPSSQIPVSSPGFPPSAQFTPSSFNQFAPSSFVQLPSVQTPMPLPEQTSQAGFDSATVNQPFKVYGADEWASQVPQPAATSQMGSQPASRRKVSRRVVVASLMGLTALAVTGVGAGLVIKRFNLSPTATGVTPTATQPLVSRSGATATPTKTGQPGKTAVGSKPTQTATPHLGQTPTSTPKPGPTNTPVAQPTNPGSTPTTPPTPSPTPIVISNGSATIKGTWSFNFDLGALVTSGGDAFWNQQTTTIRTMEIEGSSQLYNVGMVDFNSIALSDLQSYPYSTIPIDGNNDATNQLVNGDVFAVLTNGGNHAKVQVLVYGYNLQIQWVTYQG